MFFPGRRAANWDMHPSQVDKSTGGETAERADTAHRFPRAEPGAGVAQIEAEFGRGPATIFERAVEIAEDPKFKSRYGSKFTPFERDAHALAQATGEKISMGQVWEIGTYNGKPIWGTVRGYIGITEAGGRTVVVQARPGQAVRILGDFKQ